VFGRVAARLEAMHKAADAKPDEDAEKKRSPSNGSDAEGDGGSEKSRSARSAGTKETDPEENACRD